MSDAYENFYLSETDGLTTSRRDVRSLAGVRCYNTASSRLLDAEVPPATFRRANPRVANELALARSQPAARVRRRPAGAQRHTRSGEVEPHSAGVEPRAQPLASSPIRRAVRAHSGRHGADALCREPRRTRPGRVGEPADGAPVFDPRSSEHSFAIALDN